MPRNLIQSLELKLFKTFACHISEKFLNKPQTWNFNIYFRIIILTPKIWFTFYVVKPHSAVHKYFLIKTPVHVSKFYCTIKSAYNTPYNYTNINNYVLVMCITFLRFNKISAKFSYIPSQWEYLRKRVCSYWLGKVGLFSVVFLLRNL